jgi:hypothetical protein
MEKSELLICNGRYFGIFWGLDTKGRCQARDYYEVLPFGERAKTMALLKRMADFGKIFDKRKFNRETMPDAD